MLQRLSLLLLLCVPAWLNADTPNNADLVNERFITRPLELEAHWQVDCSAVRQRALAPQAGLAPQELAGDMKKCAMIYNPPGTGAPQTCPDYASAWRLLAEWPASAGVVSDTTAELRQALECASPEP